MVDHDDDTLDSPEFEERLRQLEDKAAATKSRRDTIQAQEQEKLKSDGKSAVGVGVGMTIAYAILGVPMLGALLGWLIDRSLGTNLFKGLLTLGGAVLGIVFAVITSNRQAPRL